MISKSQLKRMKVQKKGEAMTVQEINGRLTCTRCGYEWSAMLPDDDWPDTCSCEEEE